MKNISGKIMDMSSKDFNEIFKMSECDSDDKWPSYYKKQTIV